VRVKPYRLAASKIPAPAAAVHPTGATDRHAVAAIFPQATRHACVQVGHAGLTRLRCPCAAGSLCLGLQAVAARGKR
jgi:hypothetical protein